MELKTLSASSIRDYKKCPKLFLYRHVLRLKLPYKSRHLTFGGAFHSALEVYHKYNKEKSAYNKFSNEFKIIHLSEDEKQFYDEMHTEGNRLLASYFNSQEYLKVVHDISSNGLSEARFRNEWIDPISKEDLGIKITGIIDRVTEDADVVEFKTSSKPYKQEEVDRLDQATIYHRAFTIKTGQMPRRVVYIVFVKGRKDPIQVVTTTRNETDYARLQSEVKTIMSNIAQNKFDVGSGFEHRWCDCKRYEEMLYD